FNTRVPFLPLLGSSRIGFWWTSEEFCRGSLKKKKGFYIRRERQWNMHRSKREKVFMLSGTMKATGYRRRP
ncbi:hypothetical protein SO802_023717, partial [Lithocarpus litseifolius]